MFAFNQAVDKAILKPMANAYRDIVPESGRESIRNFLRNLESPTILFNDILQGEKERASNTINRFVINSSVGLDLEILQLIWVTQGILKILRKHLLLTGLRAVRT